MTLLKNKCAWLLVSCALFAGSVLAQTVPQTQTVNPKATASLVSSCRMSVQDLNFGEIPVSKNGSLINATMNLTSTCSKGVAYSYSIWVNDPNGRLISGARRMYGTSAGNTSSYLVYNLYIDSAGTKKLGNGIDDGTVTYKGTGTGDEITDTFYGTLNTNQFVTPDNYSATLYMRMAF